MSELSQPLNILEMMGYRRSHYHESIDSTNANDITIPMVDANKQYDSPTITRVTKQFAENIEQLASYIQDNVDTLKSTNLSEYITTDLEEADAMNKIFATAPCIMTSKRTLDLKNCRDFQADPMPTMIKTFFLEDIEKTSKIIVAITKDSIIRYNLSDNTDADELNMHPTGVVLYTVEDGIEIKRADFADGNELYIYAITNCDIRVFSVSEIRNFKIGKNELKYSNIVDFKKSFIDDHKRYNDNLVIEDIHRKYKILDLINEGNFDAFVDRYFKLGDFPKDVLTKASFSEDPVIVSDVGLVTGKYGVYLIHCYSRKPKNVNEFELDENQTFPKEADGTYPKTGSLHIRCLDNKPVKNSFFYENNGSKYFVVLNGWPKSDSDYKNEDHKYRGFTVFKINDGTAASKSYDLTDIIDPQPESEPQPDPDPQPEPGPEPTPTPVTLYAPKPVYMYTKDNEPTDNIMYDTTYYTIDENEQPPNDGYISRKANRWIFNDKVQFLAYDKHVEGTMPIYKYWNNTSEWQYSQHGPDEKINGSYIDSDGDPLRDADLPKRGDEIRTWQYKGIAFYVLESGGKTYNLECGMHGIEGIPRKSYHKYKIHTPKSTSDKRAEIRSRSVDFNTLTPADFDNANQVPADGFLKDPDTGAIVNVNQILNSHGINGAYVNTLRYKACTYNNLESMKGVPVNGFVIRFKGFDQTKKKIVRKYWFVESTNSELCNVVKAYDRHEFNCFSEYKINAAMYSQKDETLLVDIKDIGLVEGIKSYDADGNCGFRFRRIKEFGEYETINDMYVMNRCFVAASSSDVTFMVSGGESKTLKLLKDIKCSVKEIEFSSTYSSSNIFCIGENVTDAKEDEDNSRIALIELKYKLDTQKYIDNITQNIGDLISSDFLSKDNAISKALNTHVLNMHNSDSLANKLKEIMNMLSGRSIKQATGFSDNLRMSYIILNYPNNGNDFMYVETDENSTDIYGRINSKTLNVIPSMVTSMQRNSNAIAYYDTVTDENGNQILSTNKLVYSTCRLSDNMTRLSINVPSTGTYYVDNILGWSCGGRTGSALSRKNLDDGYIQGEVEKCTTHYQLILNRVFFNVKNILNVTAQYASAPLRIYSNTKEFDVRHYGMYDSPIIAPLNMNNLTTSFNYDMSSCSNDELILSFSLFGGDALQINILIENY